MTDKKTVSRMALFAVLWLCLTVFIFSNSLQAADDSNARSLGLMAFLRRLPFFKNFLSDYDLHVLIRKLAHFSEFAALGFAAGGFFANFGRLRGEKYVSLTLLLMLSTAVCDEYIQLFTGRTSSVKDVVIDFAGALAGYLFLRLIAKKQ